MCEEEILGLCATSCGDPPSCRRAEAGMPTRASVVFWRQAAPSQPVDYVRWLLSVPATPPPFPLLECARTRRAYDQGRILSFAAANAMLLPGPEAASPCLLPDHFPSEHPHGSPDDQVEEVWALILGKGFQRSRSNHNPSMINFVGSEDRLTAQV